MYYVLSNKGRWPYSGIARMAVMLGVGNGDLRLPVPSSTPSWLDSIFTKCWERDASLRPSFDELLLGELNPTTAEFELKSGGCVLQRAGQDEITEKLKLYSKEESVMNKREAKLNKKESRVKERERRLNSIIEIIKTQTGLDLRQIVEENNLDEEEEEEEEDEEDEEEEEKKENEKEEKKEEEKEEDEDEEEFLEASNEISQ